MQVLSKIESNLVEILEELGIEATISTEVKEDSEGKKIINVDIEGENLSELIGHHGSILESLQQIMNLLAREELKEENGYVQIDVNSYRKNRIEYIESITKKAIHNARENNQAVSLSPMKAFERRVVHMTVQEESDMESSSEGEDRERHVVITPKK